MADQAEGAASLPRIERLPGLDDNDQTFVLHKHDHTLGNSLRFMIQKDPRAEFCGYSVVHPTEDNIHLRIQSNSKDTTSVDILRTGLQNLRSASQHIAMEYEDALLAFRAKSESETQK